MEKKEKLKSLYLGIFESVKNEDIVSSLNLEKIVSEKLSELGLQFKGHSTHSRIMAKFQNILGEKYISLIGTRTLGNKKILTYKLKLSDESKNLIVDYFDKGKESGESTTRVRKLEDKPRISSIKTIASALIKFKRSKKPILTYEMIKLYTGHKSITKKTLLDWKELLKKINVDFNVDVIGNYGNRGIAIKNIDSILMRIMEVYGDELKSLNIKEALNLTRKIAVDNQQQGQEKTKECKRTDFEKSYLIYSIAGILRSSSEDLRRVEIDPLIKCLNENFSLKERIIKSDIVELLKGVPEIDILNHGGSFILKDKTSWANIVKKYGPQNFKKSFLLRVGMSLDELRSQLSESMQVELISEISPNDGIYKITYDLSIHSKRLLIGLFRKFRGKDKILDDPELENSLSLESIKIDGKYFNSKLDYLIEKIPTK